VSRNVLKAFKEWALTPSFSRERNARIAWVVLSRGEAFRRPQPAPV
jgi:hypothetical protein